MDKKITKIIKERFANNEFDVKSNLTFYKQNKAEFYEMVRHGIITKNVGGKIYLIEKPKPFWKRLTRIQKIIFGVIGSILMLLTLLEVTLNLSDRLNKTESQQKPKSEQESQIEIENNILKTDSLTKILRHD